MNDFEFSNPLQTLKGEELTNLIDIVPENERYTYIYQGNSQVLDHILVSNHLADQTEIDILHINADFTPMHGRASDHEPVLAQIDLTTNVEPEPLEQVAPVISSHEPGTVEPGTEIELSTETEDAMIYYTTDGSEPTEENGTLYDEPIIITEDIVIKAVAMKDGFLPSDVATFNYTVKEEQTGSLIIRHIEIDEAGEEVEELSVMKQTDLKVGETYVTEPLELDGYSLVEIDGEPTGTMIAGTITVTYKYVKDDERQDDKEAKPVPPGHKDKEKIKVKVIKIKTKTKIKVITKISIKVNLKDHTIRTSIPMNRQNSKEKVKMVNHYQTRLLIRIISYSLVELLS